MHRVTYLNHGVCVVSPSIVQHEVAVLNVTVPGVPHPYSRCTCDDECLVLGARDEEIIVHFVGHFVAVGCRGTGRILSQRRVEVWGQAVRVWMSRG